MEKLVDIKSLKEFFYKKNINIIAPNVETVKKNSYDILKSDLNVLVNFHIDEIKSVQNILNNNFILFHTTCSEYDSIVPPKLCINNYFFEELKKLKCKHLISLGAKFYNKKDELKNFLHIFKNISIIELYKIYEYEKKLKFLPNALILTILEVLKFNPKKIKLIGFDLHAIPSNISNKKHYENIANKKFFSSFFLTSDQHNYLNTTSLLRKLYKNKKIIVDDNLKEILTFKVSKNKIYQSLNNSNDIAKLINKLKNIKSLSQLIKYNLDLNEKIITSIDLTNSINKLNTFNKVDKIINVNYNKNINYYNTSLNINLIDIKKLFNDKFKRIEKPIFPSRGIIKNIFKKVDYWDEIFRYNFFVQKRLIIFKIKFNITVISKGIILRIFKNSKDFYEIPLLRGKHNDDFLMYNSIGEIKFDIINPPLSNRSIWKINNFEFQYVIC
ncbi:hypothetical protein [Candidatus Pelagibacter sp. HIMB1509]|uniref:hypothetical protein n=1 Tax=Candidatus Pelagibacter sp. HIMB1509 TaxID=3413339 RepID=UPI003F836D10